MNKKLKLTISVLLAVVMAFGVFLSVAYASQSLPQLNPPGNPVWSTAVDGISGIIQFDPVPNSDGAYKLSVKKDGADVDYWDFFAVPSDSRYYFNYFNYIIEPGAYTFEVVAVGVEGFSSDSTPAVSGVYNYATPSSILAVPANPRWAPDETLTAVWDAVPGADGYYIELYIDGILSVKGASPIARLDFLNSSQGGALLPGVYTFKVRALSVYIEAVGNGLFSAMSSGKDISENINSIKDNLSNILNNFDAASPKDTLDALKALDTDDLELAIKAGDTDVLNALKDLEEAYQNATGIDVDIGFATGIEEKLGDVSKIEVLGAAFNSRNGDVTLSFTGADPRPDFDENAYTHSIFVEINLSDNDGEHGKLDVPIQITMPIPPGFSPSRIHILHYNANGTVDTIWPRINGDGTMSFILTSFSVFAFVQSPEGQRNVGGSGGGYVGSSANASISRTRVDYNKSEGGDITVALNKGSYNLTSLTIGNYSLKEGTDYIVSGNNIIIKASYLATLAVGENSITFNMSGGTHPRLTIMIKEDTEEDSPVPLSPGSNPFKDVSEDDWFYDAVMFLLERGLMLGVADDEFGGDSSLTRAMIVTILYRYADEPDASDLPNPFGDVLEDVWYTDAIKWAVANGIVLGYGDGTFGPHDPVTKEQLAALIYRTQNSTGLIPPSSGAGASFPDAENIRDYAKDAVEALNNQGLFQDIPYDNFNPRNPASRAEIASMLYRYLTALPE